MTTLYVQTPQQYVGTNERFTVADTVLYMHNARMQPGATYEGPDKSPADIVLESLIHESTLMDTLATARGIQLFLPSETAWKNLQLSQRAYLSAIEEIPFKIRMGTAINTTRTFDDFQAADEMYTAETLAAGIAITLSTGRNSILARGPDGVFRSTGKWRPSNLAWIHSDKSRPEESRKDAKSVVSTWKAHNGLLHVMNGVF